MKKKIMAIIITDKNGKLDECIESIMTLTRKPNGIVIVGDEKKNIIYEQINHRDNKIEIKYIQEMSDYYKKLKRGIIYSIDKDYEWIWILNDKISFEKNALRELMNANTILARENIYVDALLSNIIYKERKNEEEKLSLDILYGDFLKLDGKLCGYDLPVPEYIDEHIEKGIIKMKCSAFSGLLIKKSTIERIKHPKPMAGIRKFTDIIYTSKMNGLFLVGHSVLHKREYKKTSGFYLFSRYMFFSLYYRKTTRNIFWLLKKIKRQKNQAKKIILKGSSRVKHELIEIIYRSIEKSKKIITKLKNSIEIMMDRIILKNMGRAGLYLKKKFPKVYRILKNL